MALKEAYDLHIRTYESQIAYIKKEINSKIYQFQLDLKKEQKSNFHCFKYFLYFVTNYLFFNFKTFTQFEKEFYSKKFNKAKIYQRIQPIIQSLFQKALARKDVFKNDLFSSEELAHLTEFINNTNECKIEHKSLHQLLHYYCNWCVQVIVKFRQFKPIQSKINPTIELDGECYRLYSEYDEASNKNRWFLDIMSMESGKRIKGLELTGFHHANEIISHFNSNHAYGQYATNESTLQLVFEDLNYTQLGRNKAQKRQINLIQGILTVLEEKIKQMGLPIEVHYVNPAYTSQTCPNCYYVDRNNRDSKQGKFRCCHCGFTAIDDVTYQGLTQAIPKEHLPPEDDFIAACNIAQRLSVLPDSTKLHKDKIKDFLMQKHAEIKGYCKMFHNIKCCSP